MKRFMHVFITACAALYLAVWVPAHADEMTPIAVVISSSPELASVQQVSARELGQIFLRKKQYWSSGGRIHPVNLHAEHALRLAFSKTVLGSLPSEQADYWNGLYFHGITPPQSLQSEEAVLRYISTTKGAIGYISGCSVDERVKPVLWITDSGISSSRPSFNCTP